MENIKPLSILLCICLLILPYTNTQNLVTGDYSNMSGIQVYFVATSNVYLFGSFSGSSSQITGTIYLFMSETQSKIDSSNGVWAGVGFGSSDMNNSDMVMCTYAPNNKFSCYDTWSTAEVNPKSDTSLGGKDDIKASSGTITSVSVNSYKTLITFTFTKDISNLDKFDWSNFASWQTNKGGISGAYGYLNGSKVPLEHPEESKRLSISDGSGYRSSLTVSLGGNDASSSATTIPAGTTVNTSTNSPTVTTPTKSSFNGSKGIKTFDIIAAAFSILLVILI